MKDRCVNTQSAQKIFFSFSAVCQKYFIMSKILEIRGCLPSQINRREWGTVAAGLGKAELFVSEGGGALSLHAVDTVTPDTSLLLVRKGGGGELGD